MAESGIEFTLLCIAFKPVHPISHHPSLLEVCFECVLNVVILLVLLYKAPLDVPGLPVLVHQIPAAFASVESPHRRGSLSVLRLRLSQVGHRG